MIFILSISTDSVFADIHPFKYTPNDEGNTSSTLASWFSVGTDGNGEQFWYRTSGSLYQQNLTTSWTTSNYVYVFIEASSTFLYNQTYFARTGGSGNLSFYASTGHNPDKLATFLVNGRYISMYRYYTEAGVSVNNLYGFLPITTNGSSGTRIYGIVPSSSGTAPPVTDEASMYDYLGDFFDDSTHIVAFTPNDGDVLASSTPVNFSLDVYIAPEDVGEIAGVRIIFHNIDQNTLLSALSDDDIVFYNSLATTSGSFHFASSTMLTEGNYRIEAQLDRSLAWGVLRNPFSDINDTQSHQFIVGASTFIGNISQNSFTQMQTIYSTFNSTSTASLSNSCNVLSGFDVMRCIGFLFIPSNEQLYDTMNSFKSGFLTRAPMGYFTRMYDIWNTSSTTTLPSIAVSIPTGNGTHETVSANFGDMLIGGVAQLNSVTSPVNGKSARDVLEPFVKLLIAIAVIFTILTDMSGTHRHNTHKT